MDPSTSNSTTSPSSPNVDNVLSTILSSDTTSSSSSSTTSSVSTSQSIPATEVTIPVSNDIVLHIKTLDERNFSITIPSLNIKIEELKHIINKHINLPIEQQRLIFRGRVLQNQEYLYQCKINTNMTLHLVARCADMSISSPDYSSIRSPSDNTLHHNHDHSLLINDNFTINDSSSATSSTVPLSVPTRSATIHTSTINTSTTSEPSITRSTSLPSTTPTTVTPSTTITSSIFPTLPTRNYEHIYQILHTLRTTLVAAGWEISDTQNGTLIGPAQENTTTNSRTNNNNIDTTDNTSTSSSTEPITPSTTSTTPFLSSASLAAQASSSLPVTSSSSVNIIQDPNISITPLQNRSTINFATRTRRYFVIGQWIDVLDTIEQWLEATVVRTEREFILIHYNGWPQRWDEWLHVDSPRIAPFRTRSQHTTQPLALCPLPVNILPQAPRVGPPPPLLQNYNIHAESSHSLDADDIAVTVRLRADDVRPALSRTSEAVFIMEKMLRTLTELTSEQPRREARRSALHSGAKASSVYRETLIDMETKEDENKIKYVQTVDNTEVKSSPSLTSPNTAPKSEGLLYAQPKSTGSPAVSSPYHSYDSPHRRNGTSHPVSPASSSAMAISPSRTLSFSPSNTLAESPALADLEISGPLPVRSPSVSIIKNENEDSKEIVSDSLKPETIIFRNNEKDKTTNTNLTIDSSTAEIDQETFARAARVRDYQQGLEDRYEIEAIASQLAPMMDKIGRILIDLSPHVESLSRSPTFISAETTVRSTINNSSVLSIPLESSSVSETNAIVNNELENVQNALTRLRGQVSRVRADTFRLSNDVNRLLGEVRNAPSTLPSNIANVGNTTEKGIEESNSGTATVSSTSSSNERSSSTRSPTIWRINTNALASFHTGHGNTSRFTNPSAWLASRYNINRANSREVTSNSSTSNNSTGLNDPSLLSRYIMTPAIRDAVVAGFTGLIRSPINIIMNEMNVLSVRQPGWGLATGDGSLSLIRDTEAGRRALAHSSLMQSLAFTALTNVLRSNTEPVGRDDTNNNGSRN